MTRQFVDWFSVSIQHLFYADEKGKNLDLIPSKTTIELMRQHELVWGMQHGVFSMKFVQRSDNSITLAQLKTPRVLRFFLQNKDPFFTNITQIPFFNSSAKIIYLNNLSQISNQKGQKALSIEDHIGPQDLIPVFPARFETASTSGNILSLRDAQGRILFPAPDETGPLPWTLPEPSDPPGKIKVNLEKLPAGKYGLELESGQISWFFLQDSERKIDYIGVLDLYVGGENAFLKLPVPGQVQVAVPPLFQVNFEARSLPWRYVLINRSKLTFQKLEIFNTNGSSFKIPKKPGVFRDEEAIFCPSKKPLPLKERQILKPKLRITPTDGFDGFKPDPLVLDLPTPDIKILARIPAEPNRSSSAEGEFEVYSNMYIYL